MQKRIKLMSLVLRFQSVIWDVDEMSTETYIWMEGVEITELELNTDELVECALRTNFAQDFDLNV